MHNKQQFDCHVLSISIYTRTQSMSPLFPEASNKIEMSQQLKPLVLKLTNSTKRVFLYTQPGTLDGVSEANK